MNRENTTKRLTAFSIHFAISAIAFLIVLYFILIHWYPKPHFTVNGGWQGVRIMLFVDIVLGPCMTLLLFNPLKSVRAIVFDLTLIACIQIGAFIWGVYAVHSQRPVVLTLSNGVIYPILEEELSLQEKTPDDVRKIAGDEKLPVVFAREPETPEEQAGAFTYDLVEGMPSGKLFFLFEPVTTHVEQLFSASLEKQKLSPEKFAGIRNDYLALHQFRPDELAFVPFEGKYGYRLLVFNTEGRIIDSIPDPRYVE